MTGETDFAYAARRSREEAVQAIGARSEPAAAAHRGLAALHALRSVQALADLAPGGTVECAVRDAPAPRPAPVA